MACVKYFPWQLYIEAFLVSNCVVGQMASDVLLPLGPVVVSDPSGVPVEVVGLEVN